MTYNIDDYVDVAERIREFYERFPQGRLCAGSDPKVVEIGGKPFVWYHARAYRTPDDPVPGDGFAAEPVPGPTQFTKDSELMNAETAAWGRAIVALGFATKKIASAQEVRNRSGNETAAAPRTAAAAEQAQAAQPSTDGTWTWPFGKHKGLTLADTPAEYLDWFMERGDKEDIKERILAHRGAPVGAFTGDDDVPFLPSIDGIGG